jgi:hypothetical protein
MIGSPAVVTGPRGIGLAVLLHTGLAGWLRAIRTGVGAARPERTRMTGSPSDPFLPSIAVGAGAGTALLPPQQYTEATRLLASLVLSACAGPRPGRGAQGDAR